jgi:hypothetical protein
MRARRGRSCAAGYAESCAGSTAEDGMVRRWRPSSSQDARTPLRSHQARAPTGISSRPGFRQHRCSRTGPAVHTSVHGAGPTQEGISARPCLRGIGSAQRAMRIGSRQGRARAWMQPHRSSACSPGQPAASAATPASVTRSHQPRLTLRSRLPAAASCSPPQRDPQHDTARTRLPAAGQLCRL